MTSLHRRAFWGRTATRAVRILTLAALALLTDCGFSTLVPAQGLVMRDVNFPIQDLRFPSGLRVIVEKDDRTPLVGLFLVVGAGSTSDPIGKEGLAHYIEHLTFRSRPYGKFSFQRMLERAGAGAWNAFTDLDDTVYYELGPSANLAEMLRLEGARMMTPVAQVTPETLATELSVVRNELRQRNETGYVGEVLATLQAAVFPGDHPYARSGIGSHPSLSAITPDDIKAFLEKNYRPENMTLVVLGNVDTTTAGLVEQSLPPALLSSPTPVHPPPRMPKVGSPPPAPPPGQLLRKEGTVATPELWIGWSLPRSFDTESYVIEFVQRAASERFGGAESQDEDIAFVTTSIVPGALSSMLLCRVVLNRGIHPERSLDHVLNRLGTIWAPSVDATNTQIRQARFTERQRGTVVGMILEAEDLTSRGVKRATGTHFSQDPALYSRGLRDLMAMEEKTVIDYAYKYLTRDRARAVLFTPPTGGGVVSESKAISSPAVDDDDPRPIRADAERLRVTDPGPGASRYRSYTLENGLEVILGSRRGMPLVSVGLLFPGGIGAAKDPVAAEAANVLASPRDTRNGSPAVYGARMGHRVGLDSTLFVADGASGNVSILLASMAERVRSMYVPSDRWPYFKRYYVPFMRLSEQKPETIANRAFMASLFAGNAYGRSVTGKDLEDVGAGATEAWVDKTYTPDHAVLAIVGEINPAEVEEQVAQFFGGWSPGASDAIAPSPPQVPKQGAAATSFVVTSRPGATQSEIRFGCLLPPASASAMDSRHDVSAQLLQDRMRKVLREKLGVTYGLHAGATVFRGGSAAMSLGGDVESDKLAPALAVIKETIEQFAAGTIPENDLAWAKLRRAREQGVSFMTNHQIMSELLADRNMGYAPGRRDGIAGEIAAVDAAGVKEDFDYCLRGHPTLSVVGDEAGVRAALKEGWK